MRFASVTIQSIIIIIVFPFFKWFHWMFIQTHTVKSQKNTQSVSLYFKLLSFSHFCFNILTPVIWSIFNNIHNAFNYTFVCALVIRFFFLCICLLDSISNPRPFHMHKHKCATYTITTHTYDWWILFIKKKNLSRSVTFDTISKCIYTCIVQWLKLK